MKLKRNRFRKYENPNTIEFFSNKYENSTSLSSLFRNDVAIFLRDVLFESDIGSVNLHPSKRTHCVA